MLNTISKAKQGNSSQLLKTFNCTIHKLYYNNIILCFAYLR